MYNRILVPLDGSELAECVLPHVETILNGCGVSEIVLLRVVEPASLPAGVWTDGMEVFTEDNAKTVRENLDAKDEKEAAGYLSGIAGRFKPKGIKIQEVVLKGKPADELIDYVKESDADLLVIASHGRSGISRWIYGSVAERLLRSVCIPLLMVRAPGCEFDI